MKKKREWLRRSQRDNRKQRRRWESMMRKKRSSEKGRADEMGRPEGVESHTDQRVLASQGWRSIFGGSSVQAG
jgi:hypothetical protein